jgi:hypothetical protein
MRPFFSGGQRELRTPIKPPLLVFLWPPPLSSQDTTDKISSQFLVQHLNSNLK